MSPWWNNIVRAARLDIETSPAITEFKEALKTFTLPTYGASCDCGVGRNYPSRYHARDCGWVRG